jgi:hypothetical protein
MSPTQIVCRASLTAKGLLGSGRILTGSGSPWVASEQRLNSATHPARRDRRAPQRTRVRCGRSSVSSFNAIHLILNCIVPDLGASATRVGPILASSPGSMTRLPASVATGALLGGGACWAHWKIDHRAHHRRSNGKKRHFTTIERRSSIACTIWHEHFESHGSRLRRRAVQLPIRPAKRQLGPGSACRTRTAGIRRVKGVPQLGRRVGNWLTAQEGEKLLWGVDHTTLRGKRGAAIVSLLLGCVLRRSEIVGV